jgi:hypothetical protein
MSRNYSVQDEQAEVHRATAYRDWLGIENPIPTYYQLLGLPGLESDDDAIFEAGREVKRKLRSYQVGRYRALALELLAEVGQAVSILTNPEKKRAYDADLARGWRTAAEELYDTHAKGRAGDLAALEAWLLACRSRWMPVVRLMPCLFRLARARRGPWPGNGPHGVDLMTTLWVYRDVGVIGQCVETAPLEKRVQSVKRVQQALCIPEALARVVAEGVSGSRRLFGALRLVRQARQDPDAVLLRLTRRMRRFGGLVGHRSKVLVAIGRLLGKHRQDLQKILARVDEPTVELSPGARASRVARKARKQAHVRVLDVRYWVEEHPQLLVIAAVALGVVTFAAAVLVATGVWRPWGEQVVSIEPHRPREAAMPPVAPPKVAVPEPAPGGKEPALPPSLMEFIMKYPTGGPPPPAQTPPKPAEGSPVETKPPPDEEGPNGTKPPNHFFGIPIDSPKKQEPAGKGGPAG